MPFYRQTIGGRFYKDYKNGNSKRVSEKEYLKNVRRVNGGAECEGEAKSAVENKVIGSKKYTCECSCEKTENSNENSNENNTIIPLVSTASPVSTASSVSTKPSVSTASPVSTASVNNPRGSMGQATKKSAILRTIKSTKNRVLDYSDIFNYSLTNLEIEISKRKSNLNKLNKSNPKFNKLTNELQKLEEELQKRTESNSLKKLEIEINKRKSNLNKLNKSNPKFNKLTSELQKLEEELQKRIATQMINNPMKKP